MSIPRDPADVFEIATLSNQLQQAREEIQRLRGLLFAQLPGRAPAPEPDGLDAFPSEGTAAVPMNHCGCCALGPCPDHRPTP